MRTVSVSEMKEIERKADENGLPYYQMMENAGTRAFETVKSEYPDCRSLLIFCGKGNNGGDGLVIARLAANEGMSVTVVLAEGIPVTEDAKTNFDILPEKVSVVMPEDISEIDELNCELIIDALYGTGFHGELRESGIKACELMNSIKSPVFSLDLPSGCNADTAETAAGAVKADITVVFDSYKNIHASGNECCGKCILVDIGIPDICH